MKVKLGMGQEDKTDVIKRTLNPRFNATFDLLVYERSVEVCYVSYARPTERFFCSVSCQGIVVGALGVCASISFPSVRCLYVFRVLACIQRVPRRDSFWSTSPPSR